MSRFPLVLLALFLTLPTARAGVFLVASNDDSGGATLRQAILDANSGACTSPCEIAFTESLRIELLSELPALTASSVTIRAAQQTGPVRPDATINGARAGAGTMGLTTGLRIHGAKDVQVRALTFEEFDTGISI